MSGVFPSAYVIWHGGSTSGQCWWCNGSTVSISDTDPGSSPGQHIFCRKPVQDARLDIVYHSYTAQHRTLLALFQPYRSEVNQNSEPNFFRGVGATPTEKTLDFFVLHI